MMTSDDLRERIEAIETATSSCCAYAAQGRQTDKGARPGATPRVPRQDGRGARGASGVVDACAKALDPELPKKGAAFFAAVDADARVALAAIRPCSRARMSARSSSTT
jgi:hypothetical protein